MNFLFVQTKNEAKNIKQQEKRFKRLFVSVPEK